MRKWFGLLFVFILMFGMSLPAVQAEEINWAGLDEEFEDGPEFETEPNNEFGTANAITTDSWVSGSLSNTDIDTFKVAIPSKGVFSLFGTTFSDEVYGQVVIYDEQGNSYESACAEFYCEQPLDAGNYYIQINSVNDTENAGIDYEFLTFFTEAEVNRISGKNRYETATNIANEGWPEGAEEIVLATGENFPDALAAGPFAYDQNAPILLTTKNSLPPSVSEFIADKGVQRVTIIGGTGVVSAQVENYLKGQLGLEVRRISGKDRFETAVKIANEMPETTEAVVVNGRNYPDALSISSFAAQMGIPILLTEVNSLPEVTADKLVDSEFTYVIGGKGAVSSAVFEEIPYGWRVSGKDRYETSAKVADLLPSDASFIATGANFADALSGGVVAAMYGQPIVLTAQTGISQQAKIYFENYHVINYTILGGTGAVGLQVEQQLWDIINAEF